MLLKLTISMSGSEILVERRDVIWVAVQVNEYIGIGDWTAKVKDVDNENRIVEASMNFPECEWAAGARLIEELLATGFLLH